MVSRAFHRLILMKRFALFSCVFFYLLVGCSKDEDMKNHSGVYRVDVPRPKLFSSKSVPLFDNIMEGISSNEEIFVKLKFPKSDRSGRLYIQDIEILNGSITFYSLEGGMTLSSSGKAECWVGESGDKKSFSFPENRTHLNIVCGYHFSQELGRKVLSASLNINVSNTDTRYTIQKLPLTVGDESLTVGMHVRTDENFQGRLSGASVPVLK